MAKKRVSKFANKPFDFTICITVLILLALGIVMVLSASSPSALAEGDSSYTYAISQATYAVIGIAAMFIISKIDYRFYKKYYKLGYVVAIILLALVLIMGSSSGGAKRWLRIGIRFQPSELVKILLIVFYAGFLTDHREDLGKFGKGFLYSILFVVPILGLLILEPHFSACVIMMAITCVMMLMAGCKMKHFLLAAIPAIPVIIFIALKDQYRVDRVLSFLDPWKYAEDEGWQVIQSLYAIGSGGLFGAGLGESKQKYLYVSEPQNDFIFSILAEELGFIGCAVVIILFAILIWRGIVTAMKAPDMFGSLLAIGITVLVGVQVMINIAVVTSSIPVTGMPLPFFSYRWYSLSYLNVPEWVCY